ncbi:hypothetical protein [Paracraurococcus lichenis]|uniref:Uncharacterized protein n=1 Tax=Paracraurococcus lichenis TaxID=3064888 RepID=A0ABT9E8E4_9PROT|nr:hypothetical protein [Paracraurococcus sp. LOR1-02]MDO9712449.1 hypothetical protein [Paracraurococcus sp. LOR1-02]
MKARILAETRILGAALPVGCVPDLPEKLVADLVALGAADPDPAAVAYAETLGIAMPEAALEAIAALAPSADADAEQA